MIHHIRARTGAAFSLNAGDRIRVIDVEGGQVADVYAVARDDPRCRLSNGRTFDYSGRIALTTGDVLYANDSRAMLTIVEDTVGRHDFLYSACSQAMFERQYGAREPHPNCLDNLAQALAPFGVEEHMITTPFNAFMNVTIDEKGAITITPPRSKAGDAIELRAEMDVVVGVSACSAPLCNAGTFGPIDIEITPG